MSGSSVSEKTCEVYVWGSNSSHQLAEGNQEKILLPKLAKMFTNVQQVNNLSVCVEKNIFLSLKKITRLFFSLGRGRTILYFCYTH